jgi:putative integral membrane protein (TIGR02587 family)
VSDLARAATGGLLFGVPLLYTMEVWWAGARTSPVRNLVVLVIAFGIVVVLQRTSGFRQSRDATWRDAAVDAVEVVALSLVVVTVVLFLLRQITRDTPTDVAVGKIVHQVLGFAIGASVARQYLTEGRDELDGGGDEGSDGESDTEGSGQAFNPTLADVGATAVGSTFIALNIAPTDEVPMLATALDAPWLIAVLGASLVVSYSVVFVAGFSGQRQRRAQQGIFQHPITETVVCYLVSLVAAAAMLAVFHRLDGPWPVTLSLVIVLGLPACVGGAAGRLAI